MSYYKFNSFLGTWSTVDSLNLTRIVKDQTQLVAANPLANKTFVVTVIETQPYTMLKLTVSHYKFQNFTSNFRIWNINGDSYSVSISILHF